MKIQTITPAISILLILFSSCKSVDANFTFDNYIESDVTANVSSYTNRGKLKVNESVSLTKATISDSDHVIPTSKSYSTKGYKGGNIRINYYPNGTNTRFTKDPIPVPNSNLDLNQEVMFDQL